MAMMASIKVNRTPLIRSREWYNTKIVEIISAIQSDRVRLNKVIPTESANTIPKYRRHTPLDFIEKYRAAVENKLIAASTGRWTSIPPTSV